MEFWHSEILLMFLAHFDERKTAFRFLKNTDAAKSFLAQSAMGRNRQMS
jgi:hypothetical protein